MADPISNSWVGYYAYDPIEGVDVELPIVTFKMSWEFGWFGRFVGSVNDGPNSDMLETGKITGRFRSGKIEFTKYMPVGTYMNPNGSAVKTDGRHPPIHYYGTFDSTSNSIDGKWYIAPFSHMLEEYPGCSGTWTAKPTKRDAG